ncbi:antibiotic resistance protein VanZ [Enterococcus villorum]|uniref:Antibiotic resistance protein VanZ n=3 Tax=Enterococcus villorum TaxID=112904 RepID=A0A1V8YEX0_9ENTE|nr:antibiotic resistance protein VanZ [Enterococcus villorum]
MLFLNISLLCFSLLFSRWFYMKYLYFYSLSIFPPSGDVDFWIPLTQIIIITFFLYIFLLSFFTKKIYKEIIIVFYILYFMLLIYLLLFKNIGIRGFELNPLSFITDFIDGDAVIVLLNIVMFIPLGWLLSFNKKNLGIVVLGIFLIEVAQYVFYLGIFDVGDIIANTAGFIVGTIVKEYLFNKISFKIVSFNLNRKNTRS